MTDRKSLLREAYAACRRHVDEKYDAENRAIYMEMERSELQYDLAEALGMSTRVDETPSFEAMLTRIRELRLTLKQRGLIHD